MRQHSGPKNKFPNCRGRTGSILRTDTAQENTARKEHARVLRNHSTNTFLGKRKPEMAIDNQQWKKYLVFLPLFIKMLNYRHY